MKKEIVFAITVVLFAVACVAIALHAQSGTVIFFSGIPGTTKAQNCGTPSAPSVCIVGDGVWIWQSSTLGWFLASPPAPPASSGVKSVQGVAPGPNGDVDLKCSLVFPSMAATFSGGVSTSATISTQTLLVPCVGSGN